MFSVPSVVKDPNYGVIAVLSVIPFGNRQQVIFQDSQGRTNLGFFDNSGNAIGRPVRWSDNGSGLIEFSFPGASASDFIVGPNGNVTSC